MGFFTAIGHCFGHYFDFQGRARRSEYWFWGIFVALVTVIAVFASSALSTPKGDPTLPGLIGLGLILFYIVALIPSLAVTVRRLHDTGRTGWWYLISFVPFGGFVLLVFTLLDSEPCDNKYGPSPKQRTRSYEPEATPSWVDQADARARAFQQDAPARSGRPAPAAAAPRPASFGQRPTFGRRQTPPGPARA